MDIGERTHANHFHPEQNTAKIAISSDIQQTAMQQDEMLVC